MARRAPNSRPVHPCYLSVWEGNAGSELSTWAKITTDNELPNLVTAQGNTLTVYSVESSTGKLMFVEKFPNLHGNVCFLETLRNPDHGSDALLLGFSGLPRLAVVTIKSTCPKLLLATTLFDLTSALQELSYGSVTPLEQDLQATLLQKPSNTATITVTLGGGVALACLQLRHIAASGWKALDDKPYLLPLQNLSVSSLDDKTEIGTGTFTSKDLNQSIVTGFGDILSTAFLPGYLEPTMVILHSNPHSGGRAWSGRLGRQEGGTRYAMILTAVTITVSHHRSAVLWTTHVPADALHVYPSSDGCLVHCANSFLAVSNVGQIQQCLAVNGWARSSMTSDYNVQPNPWPFPKLSIALDGAQVSFVSEKAAFCVLRYGQVFLLQYTNAWSLLPLYTNIGAIGQIANLAALPLGNMLSSKSILDSKLWKDKQEKPKVNLMETGLLFAGSRLGDSSMLGYALETTSIADAMNGESVLRNPKLERDVPKIEEVTEYGRILQEEEAALYAAPTDIQEGGPAIIPPSDDEDSSDQSAQQRKRARLSQLVVARALTNLDSLTALGPLGPGCTGPLSKAIETNKDEIALSKSTAPTFGAPGYIFPCGYGSSGGLALLTAPGKDDRTIIAEEDCVNTKAIFNLPSHGLVVLSMDEGIRFLKLDKKSGNNASEYMASLEEMDLKNWCSEEAIEFILAENVLLLTAAEIDKHEFSLLIGLPTGENYMAYHFLVLSEVTGTLSIKTKTILPIPEGLDINTVTPMKQETVTEQLVLACTLSSGDAMLFWVEKDGSLKFHSFEAHIPMEMEEKTDGEEEAYYENGRIIAVDIFEAPKAYFVPIHAETSSSSETMKQENKVMNEDSTLLDEDDQELYGEPQTTTRLDGDAEARHHNDNNQSKEKGFFFAICRQSGALEVYDLTMLVPGHEAPPSWTAFGLSHGIPQLQSQKQDGLAYRAPRSHKVCTHEMRFFFCGPSLADSERSLSSPCIFCVAVETSDGDILIYSADSISGPETPNTFSRVPLKNVTRPSQEQSKHFSKLRRKGIVKDPKESETSFRHNHLFAFENLSGQDGLFAAVARPIWLVAERGRIAILHHRSRHAAPAGGSPRPVVGFCSGLLKMEDSQESGFLTVHERVGQVGSQRITAFNSLLNLPSAHGLLPGGGLFVQKIPLGVTVRRIQFIDNQNASSGSQPLYAVLVSREIETDQSDLNNDGLTPEERQNIIDEKENVKLQRQVEADLGGFDIEQEWVEEIEREDCFKIDTGLGGAPPIQKTVYSLWIVDAANGWMVVDSYEFDESEHGISMEVMYLSEFMEEPGTSNEDTITEQDLEKRLFITAGTAIVDKDGEDVSSKGRVLLFELSSSQSQPVELNVVYEKKIFHGPVSFLNCLVSEGKHRLVIGAGADINVEQWGADKLTQVGFFRATMYVLDIKLFKNFFVLSDAYDSLYFLVWRESDKSLTLLAKDYDPIPVYAAGLLSRGGSLDIVCHDDRQNLQFFQYAPGDAAARGGNKLVCRADFHLGSQTTELQSFFCRSSLLVNSATPASSLAALRQQDKFFERSDDAQRLGIHFGTSDGGYGAIVPLSEPIYWRLTALQSVIVNALESDCSLSQRAWRLYRRTPRRGGCRSNERKKGVIDGDLLMQYTDLSIADQEDLASAIGSTVELILDNLLELRCSAQTV